MVPNFLHLLHVCYLVTISKAGKYIMSVLQFEMIILNWLHFKLCSVFQSLCTLALVGMSVF